MVYCKVFFKIQDGLLNTADNKIWAQVNGTHISTTLNHQIPPPGGIKGYRGDGGEGYNLTKHQPDPQTDDMSCWPAIVPLLTTRCLYWMWGWVQGAGMGHRGVRGHWGLHMKNEDCLLQSTLENSWQSIAGNRTWAQVNGMQVHNNSWPPDASTWGQWRPYGVMGVRGTSDKTSAWPTGWPNVMLTCSSTHSWLDTCTGGGGGVSRGANRGIEGESVGHWGVTYEKWRWSIAKYSWKIMTVYCRQ